MKKVILFLAVVLFTTSSFSVEKLDNLSVSETSKELISSDFQKFNCVLTMNVTHTNIMTGESYTTTQTVQLGTVNTYSECQSLASNFVNFLNQAVSIFNP